MKFVDLINKYKIMIPKIQRDYAQGRARYNKTGIEIKSEKPYQVRTGLVNSLFEGVNDSKRVDLNFVYGKKTAIDGIDIFIPIDGQQRLTTLFLFHWYVYQRAELLEDIRILGDSFSYDTRDTSKSFCEALCKDLFYDNDNERLRHLVEAKEENRKEFRLSTRLMDKIWFNSSLATDPSVISMLNMLDAIEFKFASSGNYSSKEDFVPVANLLRNDDCPIIFSYLDVEEFDDEDMYIKMNARGKELTNFEIFKAKLEEDFSALCNVCYLKDDSVTVRSSKIAKFIGMYNNEFTNLFYSMPEVGREYFDTAIFNFIECFLKYDHFAQITGHTKISEEDYYTDFSITDYTGASLFNDYVMNPTLHGYSKDNAEQYVQGLKMKAKESLVKATKILIFFVENGFDNLPIYKDELMDNNIKFNEKQLFLSNNNKNKQAPHNVLVKQYALFSFLYALDCTSDFESKEEAYREWKRFVFNVTYKFTIKDPVNFAKLAGVFDAILLKLKEQYADNISAKDVLAVIRDYNEIDAIRTMPMDVIRHLFDSEARKAKLMLDQSEGDCWGKCIQAAESYYEDGNIDFLFEAIDSQMTPSCFSDVFEKSKQWISGNKDPLDCRVFNEALLCLNYEQEFEKTAHLKIYTYDEAWQLYLGKQKNLRDALLNGDRGKSRGLQKGVKLLLATYDTSVTPQEYTDRLLASYSKREDAWLRNTLVSERLVGKIEHYSSKYCSSGTIGRWGQASYNEYIMFYSTAYNSSNLEFNTFRLAMKLIDDYPDVKIERIVAGKPRIKKDRFVKLHNKSVSYDVEQHMFYNIDLDTYFEAHNDDNGMEEAINYLIS